MHICSYNICSFVIYEWLGFPVQGGLFRRPWHPPPDPCLRGASSRRYACALTPPRTLSFAVEHVANRGADTARRPSSGVSIFGGSALCSAPPKQVFRALPCTLILRTPDRLQSLSGHSSGFEDVSSNLRPESVRFWFKIAFISLVKVLLLLVPVFTSNED